MVDVGRYLTPKAAFCERSSVVCCRGRRLAGWPAVQRLIHGLMAFARPCMLCLAHWNFHCIGAIRERRAKGLRVSHHRWFSCGGMLCLGDVGHARTCDRQHTAAISITPAVVFPRAVPCKVLMDITHRVSWVVAAVTFVAAGFRRQVTIAACNASSTRMTSGMAAVRSAWLGRKTRRLNPHRSAIILANGSSGLTPFATETQKARSLRPRCAAIVDKILVSSPPDSRMASAAKRSTAFSRRRLRCAAGDPGSACVSSGRDPNVLPSIDFVRAE